MLNFDEFNKTMISLNYYDDDDFVMDKRDQRL